MRILFSTKPDWEADIRAGFDGLAHEIAFADFATAPLREHDLVVPLTVAALRDLHARYVEVAANPIPIPSPQAVALCDDKLHLNRALEKHGFVDCVPMMGRYQAYPYILKKRSDEWGANSHIVREPLDETPHAERLASADYFRQEYIPGRTEYTTHVVFKDGRIACAATLAFAFEHEVFIKGRVADSGRTRCDCAHLDLFARILAAIGFEGLCCFNYKLAGKQPLIFEINPRFGASLSPLFAAFVDALDLPDRFRAQSTPFRPMRPS